MKCKMCGNAFSGDGKSALCSACRKKVQSAAAGPVLKAPPRLPSAEGDRDRTKSKYTLLWRAEPSKSCDIRFPIAVTARGPEILVLDQPDDYRLLRFDERGRCLGTLAQMTTGDGEGELSDPQGLCSDGEGRVYVADAGADRISVWDRDGKYLCSLGGTGAEPGRLARPADMDVDEDGFLYVADTFNRRVQKLSPDGLPCLEITASAAGPLAQPVGIALNAAQEIFVADFESQRLLRFSSEGTPLKWPALEFQGPGDVRIGRDGRVYVSDRQNLRVQRFAANGAAQGVIDLGGEENAFFEGGDIAVLNDSVLIPDRFNDRLLCMAFA